MQEDEVLNNHYFVVFQNNPQLITLLEKAEQEPQSILQEDKFEIETFKGNPGQINLTLSTVFDENQLPSGLIISFEDLSSINKVTSTFKKYVSENIVDELLKNDTLMELGGVQNDVCVLFCDIRGFTSMSEKMKPNEVVYLLNNYFEAMIEVVFKFNGTLDKIIGDELMVLYGVPIQTDNDAQSAVNSAVEMMATLRRFNNEMESKGYPKLQIGIGINAGQVVCGNIGSKRQMNYTVIGDPVNLAARLCSHAKPGEIVISKSVLEQLNNSVGFEEKNPIFVKGKKAQIQNWIYKATY
jgi:class 3 adenylate cyclase